VPWDDVGSLGGYGVGGRTLLRGSSAGAIALRCGGDVLWIISNTSVSYVMGRESESMVSREYLCLGLSDALR
jgi:hypothetical protein